MNVQSIIRKLISESGWSQNRLGNELFGSAQNLSKKMRASDMKAGDAAKALDALGYRLAVVPKGVELPKGSLVVDGWNQQGGE